MYILFQADFDEHCVEDYKFFDEQEIYMFFGVNPSNVEDSDYAFVSKLIKEGEDVGEWVTYRLIEV